MFLLVIPSPTYVTCQFKFVYFVSITIPFHLICDNSYHFFLTVFSAANLQNCWTIVSRSVFGVTSSGQSLLYSDTTLLAFPFLNPYTNTAPVLRTINKHMATCRLRFHCKLLFFQIRWKDKSRQEKKWQKTK
jgi:hypothetical protein